MAKANELHISMVIRKETRLDYDLFYQLEYIHL